MAKFSTRQISALRTAVSIFRRQPGASGVNLLCLTLVFALIFSAYLLFYNLMRLSEQIDYEPAVSVYLSPTATPGQLSDAGVLIQRLPGVKSINVIKKETALARMKTDADMKQALSLLEDNPFPDTIVVRPKTVRPSALTSLKAELTKIKAVDRVDVDDVWASRLDTALNLGRSVAVVVAALLLLTIIATTVSIGRIEVLRDADEIDLASRLGGTPMAIRRPYVYYGLILGIVSALFTVLLILGAFWAVTPDVLALAKAYDSGFTPAFVPTLHWLGLVLLNGILGAAGGWIAARGARLR